MQGLQESPSQFYEMLNGAVKTREIPNIKLSKIYYSEGGILSSKREYYRVIRKEHVFDICAAPFGNSFFISWWLCEKEGFWAKIPILGRMVSWLFSKKTYFRHDTAIMFQELFHSAILEVIDGMTKANGLRALSESERKPVMSGFFKA